MKTRVKVLLPFGILMVAVLILPVIVMLVASFQDAAGGFTFGNYRTIFGGQYYRHAITNSLWISLLATVIGEIIALVGAWAITKLTSRAQEVLMTVLNMAASFAGIPLIFALIILLGNAGILKAVGVALQSDLFSHLNLYSLPGLILAYTFFEVPLGMMFLFPPFKAINRDWQAASQMLGANRFFYLTRIVLPILLPNLIETFVILFANAMGTYETMYALTGNNIVSIPTIIGALVNGSLVADIPLACAFATIFAGIVGALVVLSNLITRRGVSA